MRRKHTGKLAAGLCALALALSALLAGCDTGGSPTPTPNPTRTFGPGVYRHVPDTRVGGAPLSAGPGASHTAP